MRTPTHISLTVAAAVAAAVLSGCASTSSGGGLPSPSGGGGTPGGGGGGGRGGNDTTLPTKIAQAKNAMMGGMWPTSIAMKAYTDAKTEAPKTLSDANALFAKAATVSASLAKFSLKLDAPKPVEAGTAAKKKSTIQ